VAKQTRLKDGQMFLLQIGLYPWAVYFSHLSGLIRWICRCALWRKFLIRHRPVFFVWQKRAECDNIRKIG